MTEKATSKVCLQLFAKLPRAGKVKTRLIPDIGAKAATEVYHHCLSHNLSVLKQSPFKQQLWLDAHEDHPLFRGLDIRIQHGSDLGEKMLDALRTGLADSEHVILMGSDCLHIDQSLLQRVHQSLAHHELVVVPALDGGYVLIAVARHVNPELFLDIPWSTAEVLPITLERCSGLGIRSQVLNPLRDIDHASDLAHYEAFKHLLN